MRNADSGDGFGLGGCSADATYLVSASRNSYACFLINDPFAGNVRSYGNCLGLNGSTADGASLMLGAFLSRGCFLINDPFARSVLGLCDRLSFLFAASAYSLAHSLFGAGGYLNGVPITKGMSVRRLGGYLFGSFGGCGGISLGSVCLGRLGRTRGLCVFSNGSLGCGLSIAVARNEKRRRDNEKSREKD